MNQGGGLWGSLPTAASDAAQSWNDLYYFLFAVCVIFFAIVIIPMVYFVIRYRARPGVKAGTIAHNIPIEIIWTVVPTILVMFIFAWGWIVYSELELQAPSDAMEVKVAAQRWQWTFQYDDGRITTNQLFVPVHKAVRVAINSKQDDVLHSFFVPNFRIKKDAVPGQVHYTWFKANQIGQHQIFCAEYCGAGHSGMMAKVIVLSEEQFQLWKWGKEVELPPVIGVGKYPFGESILNKTSDAGASTQVAKITQGLSKSELVVKGKQLSQVRGCVACHSDDGSKKIGPSYKGFFGHEVVLANGDKTVADENYIRESILEPQKKIVKGFEGALMPSYIGQFNDDEMAAVTAYLKSLN